MRKVAINVSGEGWYRTIIGMTDMPDDEIRAYIRGFDEEGLRTLCAVMEAKDYRYYSLEDAIDAVIWGTVWLTGAHDYYEQAELVMNGCAIDGRYYDDERPDMTVEEIADELEFDSQYAETSFGILKMNH